MVEISATMVNELRQKTGAGMMDCRNALKESQGDQEKAIEILRKKGVADAAKRSGRTASQGLIESYIHTGGVIGVIVELNCETDFVAKTDEFKQLARDICMQVAAAHPLYLSINDVAADIVQKEKEIALEQCQGKPEQAREKIVEGKISKWLSEVCLLEQPFVKDPNVKIKDLITQTGAKMRENIVLRRFMRYQLGA
jgi:elongation factor Ts